MSMNAQEMDAVMAAEIQRAAVTAEARRASVETGNARTKLDDNATTSSQ